MKFSYALLAAFLFGLSTPLSKILLNDFSPVMLASLYYLGSGFILYVLSFFKITSQETSFEKNDIPYIIGFVVCGGIIAPVMFFTGLKLINALNVSILLNFELILTALIAWLFFKEHISLNLVVSMILITLSAIMLGFDIKSFKFSSSYGVILVMFACFMWAIDNNLTSKISLKNPLNIAIIKGLAGGSINFILAFLTNQLIINITSLLYGTIVGFICYGISLYLLILAMRYIGASRAIAIFSTNPFIGIFFSFLLLNEPISFQIIVAFFLASLAVFLVLTEKHSHLHKHEFLEHEHLHIHDEHHKHKHDHEIPKDFQHTHRHIHEEIEHSHPHTPDIHHKHNH